MAEQLKLVKTYDFESDVDSVSLISNTDGFDVAYEGWTPNVIPDRTGKVQEALTLRVQGTSTDAIATSLQKLADKAEEVIRYQQNGARDNAVWFRVQMSGETKGRQTLVHELRHEPASSVFDYALRQSYHWNKYTLGITREPWWEGTACGTITLGTIGIIGGTATYSGTIKGDFDARIAQVKVSQTATQAGGSCLFPFGDFWLGYRSNRYGTASSFNSYLSFGNPANAVNNTLAAGYGSGTTDAASPAGTSIYMTQAESGGYLRIFKGYKLPAWSTDPANLMGDHMVLAKARINGTVDPTTIWLLQLQGAYAEDYGVRTVGDVGETYYPNAVSFPRVPVDYGIAGTAYRYYEMGKITIPPMTVFKNQFNYNEYSLIVNAQCVSGTSDIWLDGLILIPTEGYIHVGSENLDGVNWGTTRMYAVNGPNGNMEGYGIALKADGGTLVATSGVPVVTGLATGTAGAWFLAACASNNLHSNSTHLTSAMTVSVEIKYFERWKEMRGND